MPLQRKSDGEHEATRRMKTQFLIEMEGCDTGSEQILLIGKANNLNSKVTLEQQIDHKTLMRQLGGDLPSDFIFHSLPQANHHLVGCKEARAWIVRNLLEKDGLFKLSTEDIDTICKSTEGYSGSDMKNLVKDASMGPLREAFTQGIEITNLRKEDLRAVTLQDFENSLQEVRPSVSLNELGSYEDWDSKFGSFSSSTKQPPILLSEIANSFSKRESWMHRQIPQSPSKAMELTETLLQQTNAIFSKHGLLNDYSIDMLRGPDGELPAKLRSLETYLIERISNEIMSHDPNVRWEDIENFCSSAFSWVASCEKCVTEMVIWPLLRPDIFKGCRSPGRGLLLFGPPGTGKTMIGKAIAGEAKATFFYISASSVLGKWVRITTDRSFIYSVGYIHMGEGEKLVRALFGVANCRRPAVIFVDEIDSLLSQVCQILILMNKPECGIMAIIHECVKCESQMIENKRWRETRAND
ncbi:hypothetical protein OSB04_027027 [Centaurea solstitialis]|uniref:AAA+ ATPase domain-containing protein n=1 Tax=Centaurea solstitialis TaxID=347529 RepID=A0AA38SQ27_9ASTR|nr:hypothetical protein OSB04_027027 [Centaurea solstitialis]